MRKIFIVHQKDSCWDAKWIRLGDMHNSLEDAEDHIESLFKNSIYKETRFKIKIEYLYSVN